MTSRTLFCLSSMAFLYRYIFFLSSVSERTECKLSFLVSGMRTKSSYYMIDSMLSLVFLYICLNEIECSENK